MGDTEDWLVLEWVVLVKMEMIVVLKCRPALAAGGAVSRTAFRQWELGKATARFARKCFWSKLLVGETNERAVS